ncbi:MAG: glycosyltransferase family 4 protein [Acidimicrobiales bacterium]
MSAPPRLRVAFYTDSPVVGGAENVARSLVASLGPRVEPIVLGTSTEVVAHISSGRAGTEARVLGKVAGRSDLRTVAAHAAELRDLGADVVQVDRHLWSGQYGVLAAWCAGVPALCVVHGVLPADSLSQRALTMATARLARRYVGVSDYVSRQVCRQLRVPAARVTTVHNGLVHNGLVHDDPVHDDPVHDDGTAAAGSAREPVSVLCVGRLAFEKGFDVLVRAIAALPGADAVVVGDGAERSRLEALASELGVAGRVRFDGWVEGWAARYQPAIVVVPSRHEALSLVALEAMRAGLPVVATRVGGLPEVVDEPETGVLVEPDDAAALAGAIGALLGDAPRRTRMGAAGRERVAARFDHGAMVAAYEGLYASLAGRPAAQAGSNLSRLLRHPHARALL